MGAAVTHYAVVYFTLQPAIDAINNFLSHPTHTVSELQNLLNSDLFSKFSSSELNDSKAVFIQKFNAMLETNPEKAFDLSIQYMNDFKREVLNADCGVLIVE